jgi:hypothetical protein
VHAASFQVAGDSSRGRSSTNGLPALIDHRAYTASHRGDPWLQHAHGGDRTGIASDWRARIWAIAQVRGSRRQAAADACFQRRRLQPDGFQLAIRSALLSTLTRTRSSVGLMPVAP